MRLVRRTSYSVDIDQIVDYVGLHNPAAALDLWDAVEQHVERLRYFPRSGRIGRVEGTRELVISQTALIVVYHVTTDSVELLRVLHGAQQWPPIDR